MNVLQQLKQLELNLGEADTCLPDRSFEAFIASRLSESPTGEVRLLESILERNNIQEALKRVVSNNGAPGVDGMRVGKLSGYLRRHWERIRQDLLNGTHKPLPVRRREILKPDGGIRQLGIPTVLDRLIQQAIAQVLTHLWDPTFSESSCGFRRERSQANAIYKAKEFIKDGRHVCVDMDLSKFFDRVNHDRLMSRLATRIKDKRVLKLIRAYLESGVMIDGLVSHNDEGTPQGGPLSPLLSNIVLDELDKELERRNLCFVRYADDFVIYVRSERAGKRIMESVTRFVTNKLRLKVNEQKSAVGLVWDRKWLGISFYHDDETVKIRLHEKSLKRFKGKVRELTSRSCGKSLNRVITELVRYFNGWWGYFRIIEMTRELNSLEGWIRRRLRSLIWKQWKNRRTRVRKLLNRGVYRYHAIRLGSSSKGPWPLSKTKWLSIALPNAYFHNLGLLFPWSSPA